MPQGSPNIITSRRLQFKQLLTNDHCPETVANANAVVYKIYHPPITSRLYYNTTIQCSCRHYTYIDTVYVFTHSTFPLNTKLKIILQQYSVLLGLEVIMKSGEEIRSLVTNSFRVWRYQHTYVLSVTRESLYYNNYRINNHRHLIHTQHNNIIRYITTIYTTLTQCNTKPLLL